MKKISIIGSTGSIGTQTLDVVRNHPDYKVTAMTCGRNIRLMEKEAREFCPEFISAADEKDAADLRTSLRDMNVKIGCGMDGLIEAAQNPEADTVVTAIVGMIGVKPTLAAIDAGKNIALANKETLVTAGHLVMKAAKEKGVKILPVDSEHSAIFQSLQGRAESKIHKILLTASGGPFRKKTKEELKNVTVAEALKHSNWAMGNKITIDSATMVNKGLEEIEAHWLFSVDISQIEVLIQPQSIIHSAVEYEDGAVIAQLGVPDMRLPIQYALTYPNREYLPGNRLDFSKISSILIEMPDRDKFRGLDLAEEASRKGGTMPTVMNAANEYAVSEFLSGKIKFLEIYEMIEYAMQQHKIAENPDVEEIMAVKDWTEEILKTHF